MIAYKMKLVSPSCVICHELCVTCHESCVTCHESCVTCHESWCHHHESCVPIMSHVSPFMSNMSPFMSHVSPFTSHVSPFMSHVSPFMSHVSPFMSRVTVSDAVLQVLGVDYSGRFISTCEKLQKGEPVSVPSGNVVKCSNLVALPDGLNVSRVIFKQVHSMKHVRHLNGS